jgi:hypothetical protein
MEHPAMIWQCRPANQAAQRRSRQRQIRRETMIFDHRTYTVKPGMMKKQLELYEKHGLQAQIRHLAPVLYGVTETGPLNT